ncbi:MAG: hypothetical protein GKR91_17540 [Pseudomonadales bacterium]|nr:hypothetical protein [Pseudomonadales bacterium]
MHELDLNRLNKRLLLGGVAPKFASRIAKELENHIAELIAKEKQTGLSEQEARQNAREKIGDEDRIVEEALAKPAIKSWSFRYPKTVFLIAPIAIYLMSALALTILYAVLAFTAFDFSPAGPWPVWYYWFAKLAAYFSEYLLTPLIALYFCVLAINRNVVFLWPMVGLLLVVFIGSGWETSIEMPVDERNGGMSFSWGYAFIPWRPVQMEWVQSIEQLARIAVTMGLVYMLPKYYQPYAEG